MSIVPYRASNNGRIVYHDPTTQILVVHNNRRNSVELYDSNTTLQNTNNSANIGDYSPLGSLQARDYRQARDRHQSNSPDSACCCPNCGEDLTDFLGARNQPHQFRGGRNLSQTQPNRSKSPRFRSDGATGPDGGSMLQNLAPLLAPHLGASSFMHQDYFHLLADLPFDHDLHGGTRTLRGLEAPQTREDSAPGDLFNQGYFERFFQKIPPGILGSGAHAQVFKVAHVLKGIQLGVFAVKRINVGDHLLFLDQVLNEVLILYELSVKGANENNLIRYNHVWMEYGDLFDSAAYILNPSAHSMGSSSTQVPYVYILQQYCDGGHLENVINAHFLREEHMTMKERIAEERTRRRDKRGLPEKNGPPSSGSSKKWLSDVEIWKFFSDITNGVAYLHAHGILHRDLKPSNCLLESKYDPTLHVGEDIRLTEDEFTKLVSSLPKVLVSDFGEGKFLNKKQKHSFSFVDDERRGNTGTIEFTDPKLWLFNECTSPELKPKLAYQFTYDSDIYSLGMILCYLCVGRLPFADLITDFTNPETVREKIANWHATLTSELFYGWFDKRTLALKGVLSPVSEDYKVLVYSMIKGQSSTPKPSPKMFMEYLDSIKWNRFILQRNRSRSEATIVEMGNLSSPRVFGGTNCATKGDEGDEEGDHDEDDEGEDDEGEDEDYEGEDEVSDDEISDDEEGEDEDDEDYEETLDLLHPKEPQVTTKASAAMALQWTSTHKVLLIRSAYVLNLSLLEAFTSSKNSTLVTALKFGNLITLAGENYIHSDYRTKLVVVWVFMSVCGIYYL